MNFNQLFGREQPAVPKRGVHLDLKGLPPTAKRMVELLKLFAAARYNVVLVEWEDSFPWTVDERFRSPAAYTPDDIRRFTEAARALGLELIPLVQCLGHMETPLSVPGYEHLRELPDQAASLNPLHPGSRELIQSMVDDVLKLMPEARYFHLGGDESWTFGKNPATGAFVEKYGKGALYLAHVEPILDALSARGIRPILWHDMMVDWASPALKALAGKSDLMTWGYIGHPDASRGQHGTEHFRRFHEHGIVLWGATAYKGCEAGTVRVHTSDRPDLLQRQENALAWTEIAQRFGYAGVVATAWSRWNVDTLQCVPIDGALDAMILVGVILHDGRLPEGGVAACINAMEELGERARFEACRKAMERLTDVRRRGWQMVQFARQQLVLARMDPRRISARGKTMGFKVVPQLGEIVRESEDIAAEARRSFAGLLEPIWIEEYLATRLTPLREEFEALEQVTFGREPGFEGDAADVPARCTGCGRRENA